MPAQAGVLFLLSVLGSGSRRCLSLIGALPRGDKVTDVAIMNRKFAIGGALIALGLGSTALASAAGSPSVQTTLVPDVTTLAPNGIVTYTVRFGCVSTVSDCAKSVVTVDVPSPLSLRSFSAAGGFVAASSSSGSTVTFDLTDPLSAGASGAVTVSAVAPSCKNAADPQPAPAVSSVKMKATSASPVMSNAVAVAFSAVPNCAVVPYVPPPFTKWGDAAASGGLGNWHIYLPPSATPYSVEDVLPAGLAVHQIQWNPAVTVSVFCAGAYQVIPLDPLYAAVPPAGCGATGGPLEQARFPGVTQIKVDVPAGVSDYLNIRTFVDIATPPGSTITNCATYVAGGTGTSCYPMSIYQQYPLIDTNIELVGAPGQALRTSWDWLNPAPIATFPTATLGLRDVAYAVVAHNFSQGYGDLADPVLTVLLDPNMDYITTPGGNWWHSYISVRSPAPLAAAIDPQLQPGCNAPTFEVVPNFQGGQTLLRWSFKGCTLPGKMGIESAVGVYVSARLKPAVVPGTTINTESTASPFEAVPGSKPFYSWCSTQEADTNDRDGDGNVADNRCRSGGSSWVSPQGTEAIAASAEVQGALDTVPTKFPAYGTADLTGTSSYRFVLTNSGTSPLVRFDLVDILPWIGDSTVASPSTPRNSEWNEELIAIDAIERGDSSGTYVPIAPGQHKIAVSSSNNPCRWDSADGNQIKASGGSISGAGTVTGPAGCDANTWIAGPQAGARSWALLYTPTSPLQPGETIRVTLRARLRGSAPAAAATPPVSWNSLAYTATLLNTTGPFELLTGEPLQVGVRLADPALTARIGGTIWVDTDLSSTIKSLPGSGVSNIAVRVVDSTGAMVTTVYSDAAGHFEVAGLIPNGVYSFQVSMAPGVSTLAGYFISPVKAGSGGCHASQTGMTATATVTAGTANTLIDEANFGAAKLYPPT